MAQYEMSIHDYFRIIRKRKWVIILTTLTVYMAAIVYTKMQKKIYQTASRIEIVDQSNIAQRMMDRTISPVQLNTEGAMQTAMTVLKSRNLILRVANELNLFDEDSPQAIRERVINDIRNRVRINQHGTNHIRIELVSTDPQRSTDIVNKMAEVFISESLKYTQHQKNVLRDFVQEQKNIHQRQLIHHEEELLKYREEIAEGIVSSRPVNEQTIRDIQTEIEQTITARQKEEEYLEILKKRLRGQEANVFLVPEISQDERLRGYHEQINSIRNNINQLLDRYTENHPRYYVLTNQLQEVNENVDNYLRGKLSDIISKYEESVAEMWAKENQLKQEQRVYINRLRNLPREQLMLAKLQRAVSISNSRYNMFRDKLEQIRFEEASVTPSARIIDLASVPRFPIYPNERQNALAGLVIGLILGFAFGFIIESMDTSIGTIEDVEKYTQKPVLAVIPHIKIDVEKIRRFKHRVESSGEIFNERQAKLVAIGDPKSPVTEAYRTLRTNLQFALPTEKKCKKILLTSATPQEGKSTTLTNLAVIMAQAGKKTLIMSCNLRHPSVYKIFGIKKKPGITDILSGGLNWRDVVQDPGIDNLKILSAGPYPPNPSELLSSKEFDDLLADLEKEFDIIIFDSPPILPVTDAAVIASKVDGVLLVYFVGKAAREALLRAKVQLSNVNANICGLILNDIKAEGKLAYTYYYHYQYKYYGVRDAKESAI
jgi:polysaccharide biosynthesis transport protein